MSICSFFILTAVLYLLLHNMLCRAINWSSPRVQYEVVAQSETDIQYTTAEKGEKQRVLAAELMWESVV